VQLAQQSAKAEPTVNQQQIIDRYTHDIWPALSAYNADRAQGGPAAKRFFAVMEPKLVGDQFNSLRTAAESLGRQGEYDPQTAERLKAECPDLPVTYCATTDCRKFAFSQVQHLPEWRALIAHGPLPQYSQFPLRGLLLS
jgi:hypothetical protein